MTSMSSSEAQIALSTILERRRTLTEEVRMLRSSLHLLSAAAASAVEADVTSRISAMDAEVAVIEKVSADAAIAEMKQSLPAESLSTWNGMETRVSSLKNRVIDLKTELLSLQVDVRDRAQLIEVVNEENSILEAEKERLVREASEKEKSAAQLRDEIAAMTLHLQEIEQSVAATKAETRALNVSGRGGGAGGAGAGGTAPTTASTFTWEQRVTARTGTIEPSGGAIFACAFTPNNRYLVVDSSTTIRIYQTDTLLTSPVRPIATKQKPAYTYIRTLSFNSTGTRMVTSEGHDLQVWDTSGTPQQWTQLFRLTGHTANTQGSAFSPDGMIIASGAGDNNIILWSAETGRALDTMRGHTGIVFQVAFHPSGETLASASEDRSVRIWNVADRSTAHVLTGHTAVLRSLAYSPDGTHLVSGDRSGAVRLWQRQGAGYGSVHTFQGHRETIYSLTFSHDSKLLASGGADNTARIWKLSDRSCIQTLSGEHTQWIRSSSFSRDGALYVTCGEDCKLTVWACGR